MINTRLLPLSAIAAIAIAGATLHPAAAQPLKDQLVGSWVLADIHADTWDGDDRNPFGVDVQGRMILDRNGMATVVILGGDRKRFTTADRLTGSAEENQAAVQGTQAFYGTYTVDEQDHTVAFHIERSSFPNWDATVQMSEFTVDGDELDAMRPGAHGSYSWATWKRGTQVEVAGNR